MNSLEFARNGGSQPREVSVLPLTPEAFAPFGEVLSPDASGQKTFFGAPLETGAEPMPALWTVRMKTASVLPLAVTTMERHPLSAQTFIPLNGFRYLVVVAASAEDGEPDGSTVQAFLAGPQQAISYRRNVWHHGMTVLDADADFIVFMPVRRAAGNDVVTTLADPLTVVAPDARP